MTLDETIRMATEAGFETDEAGVWIADGYWTKELERFAALVAAHEREKQAEQEPVAWRCVIPRRTWTLGIDWGREYFENEYEVKGLQGVEPLYTAPVRTKDLTDDELASACGWKLGDPMYEWVVDIGRWAIAADRELNK